MSLRIQMSVATDVGLKREVNEDAYDSVPEENFYVVADGMGGHASGQVASSLAVSNLRRYLVDLAHQPGHELSFPVHPGAGPPEVLVSNAIQWANERIYIESLKERKYEGMGTTLVCAQGWEGWLVLGHVGDSRIYRYRDGTLQQVTRDHSLLNHFIDQGKITTEQEIRDFKERNIIVRALGLKDWVEPEVRVIDRAGGDVFLLCSDGLTDQVEDWIIENVLRGNRDDLPAACESLVRLANDAGGKDNCTVMLLDMVEEGPVGSVAAPFDREGPTDSEDPTEPEIAIDAFAETLSGTAEGAIGPLLPTPDDDRTPPRGVPALTDESLDPAPGAPAKNPKG